MTLLEVDKGHWINADHIERVESGLFGNTKALVVTYSGHSRGSAMNVDEFIRALDRAMNSKNQFTFSLQQLKELAAV